MPMSAPVSISGMGTDRLFKADGHDLIKRKRLHSPESHPFWFDGCGANTRIQSCGNCTAREAVEVEAVGYTARIWAQSALALILAASVGCGSGDSPGQAPTGKQHIESLGRVIQMFQGQNRGRAPGSEQELKAFIAKIPEGFKQSIRESLSVSGPEALLVSPRDNKPYIINWSLPNMMSAGKPGSTPAINVWVAHETEGVDGKRFVLSGYGTADEFDEATFRSRFPKTQ